jgi:4-amino-4-deoxy-L-arabinose transferase-like glycosyltransferase
MLLILGLAVVPRLVLFAQLSAVPVFGKYRILGRRLIRGLVEEPFSSSPVYTFWVGALEGPLGLSVAGLRLTQLGLGLLAVALTTVIATRLFGRRAGVWAGLLYGLYAPAWIYELDLVSASLAVVVGLGVLWAVARGSRGDGSGWWLAAGVLLGLAVGIRPNHELLLPLLLAWIVWRARQRREWRRGAAAAGLLLLGFGLALAPIVLFNYARSGEWILSTWSGGHVFYSGNHAQATGLGFQPPDYLEELQRELIPRRPDLGPLEHAISKHLAERAAGRRLGYGEASASYYRAGWRQLLLRPGAGLLRWLRKLYYFLNDREYLDTESLILTAQVWRRAFPLRYGLALLLALGAPWLLLARRARSGASLVGIFLVPHLVTGVAFYVDGRLRLPAAPLLAMGAGGALATLVGALEGAGDGGRLRSFARSLRSGLPAVVLAVLLAVLSGSSDSGLRWACETRSESFLLVNQARRLLAGEPAAAARLLERALSLDPLGQPDAWAALAEARRRLGDSDGAAEARRKAAGRWKVSELLALPAPEEQARMQRSLALASAYLAQGDEARAREQWEELARRHPGKPDVMFNLGVLEYQELLHRAMPEARGGAEAETRILEGEPVRLDEELRQRARLLLQHLDKALALGMCYERPAERAQRMRAVCLMILERPREARAALALQAAQQRLGEEFRRRILSLPR